MKESFLFISVFFLTSFTVFAQNTYVPDDNFEQRLIQLGYDDVLDDYVLTANISGITSLQVSNKNISDLTGIEDFTSLTILDCSENQIANLDISANINLTRLYCASNLLAGINVSSNTDLTRLNCSNNQLTNIDISANTALTNFYCYENQLTSIDVSVNINLEEFDCSFNSISSIDVSTNVNLTELGCCNNQLTNLNVSTNTNLEALYCFGNQLTSLDVSSNTNLFSIECQTNNLTSLDVSSNTNLQEFNCSENQLTSLDVRNGNNANFSSFDASVNPNLTCIYVDDKTGSFLSTWTIDANSTFVETEAECSELTDIKNIADKNSFNVYPNPAKDNFCINTSDKIETVKIYNIFGKSVKTYKNNGTYSVSGFVKGVYMLEVKTENGIFISKLVIE